MASLKWLILLFILTITVSINKASPTENRNQIQGSVFSSFGEVTNFLREWFAKLTQNLAQDYKEYGGASGHREKRDLKPPVDFEIIAQEYLLNETQQYLQQFLGYAAYLNVTNKESLDEIYLREERRLSGMSTPELLKYMTSLSKTLRFGTSGSTISINGQKFDLSHVGSWCCPF
ncbi:uncharacterized protein LOC133174227 [Saccostrea echinata]|uniref:uncharacterized protein LOC133174227 n=1 Tax=Saccostrea echinata TaxID=191078 RepID=UPI002A838145|nr:uncharacterized protein LOC133174227 [Saccostrea echinata]